MNQLHLLFISLLITALTCHGQTETKAVDLVVLEVCSHLDTIDPLEQLTKEEAAQIVRGALQKHWVEWENGLDGIPNSRRNGQNIFSYLLEHRLLLDCEKFRVIHSKIDQFMNNEDYRKLYLWTKEFLISMETETDLEPYTKHFSPSIDPDTLNKDLNDLKKELDKYKRSSSILIMRPHEMKGFFISLFDYKTGDANLQIIVKFRNTTDTLIHEWTFRTKAEIEVRRAKKKQEEKELNSRIMLSDPPPAPPPPALKSDGDR
jgi:hypothetical protein